MPIIYNPSQGLRQAVTSRLSPEEEHQLALDRTGPFDRGWRSAGLAEEGNALADEALKAGVRGDVAERERLRGLSQAKLQEAASWAPEVKTTADIDGVQSGLQWAAGGLGSGLRSTLPSAAGGLAGATAALLTRGRVSPVVGGMLGGGYPAYAMEQEESAGEALHDPRVVQRNTDEEILRASRLKGAITALPEVALPAIVGGKVVGQGAKALMGGTPLRHIGAQTLKGGAVEGGTEYAQALVGQATQNELRGDPLTDFDQRAALEEAAVGALVGKTLGAAGGVADVGHHKLVKPAVHVGKEIKKDPLGKVVDTIVDTGGKLGTAASKVKHGIEDYLDEREARKAGMSYEELMLSRMPDINPAGKSQEQLEAELQADDAQRMAAASVLAQRLAANPDASPALRQAAADFERRTQQGDPTAYEALSGVLRDERTKRDVREELLNNISSWLDSKGFKLPPERRGSAMTPGGEDIEAKVKQLWLQKHSHLSGAYNTTFPDDDTARISADAVFEWVKRGFPNFNAAARGLATVWGKEAPLVVKDAHDYMVAEGLTQRAERLDEVLKKLELVAGGKLQRLKLLGELVRPSEQERMTTVDLAVMDRLLDQFALGKIKNLGSFNEHMERVFGGRKDEALALYERLNQDELIEDTGADDRRDEADADEEREAQLEGEAQDWNSGVQEKPFPTEYRGMRGENSAGYDTLYDEAKTALNDAVREARSKGEQASAVGAWDRAQRESEGDENVLKNKEDDLIAKYGGLLRSADIKQRASEKGIEADAAARELLGTALDDYAKVQGVPVDRVRDSMLRALNRRVRFVAVNAEDRIDAVDMTSADVSTLKVRYKDDSKKYGVLVFEKLAAEQQIEQVDAETGEVRKLAVMQPLKKPQEWMTTSRKLIGFIRKAKNLDAGESFGAGQQLEQLYAGISSLFETGMFSGRVGYRNEAGGEVAWIDNKAQMPVDFPLVGEVTVADAKQQKKQAVPTEKERRDEAKREGAQWVNNPPKQTAGAVGPRTVVENDEGKLRGGRNQHHNISEQEEMDAEQVRKEDAKPRTHDELTGEPLHPATRVETKEVDTTQSDYVLDLLRKGMPAFNAKMSRATAEQRAKIKALIEKMLNSMSDLKAKVWGKNPPKDAEQFARRARLALMTLEKDQDVERTSEADEDAAESVDRHYRSLMLTSKQVEELEGNRPLWAVFEDADDGALIRFIGASTNFDAAHYVAEQDKLTLVNDVAENLKRYITRLAALDERKSNAMEPEDKKAQVRQLIKEGKIEEAKALSKEAPKPTAQIREAKPGAPGSKENPHSVPMSYTASPGELRPALRRKYAGIKKIAELIASGDRTGTTRNPQQGVLPGHYVTFPGVPGLYRVTGFEKIDLNSPEGIARWEEREGWDWSATKQRFAGQVEHGKLQMVFERAEEPSQQLRGAASAETQPVAHRRASMQELRKLPDVNDRQFAELADTMRRKDNSPYILKETKTSDDIQKIANEVLLDVVTHPENYAVQVKPGELTAANFFTDEETGEKIDVTDERQHYRLSDQGRMLARFSPQQLRAALDEEALRITEQRQTALRNLAQYLTNNEGYSPTVAGRIVLLASKLSYTESKMHGVSVVKQAANNRHVFTVSGELAAHLKHELSSGASIRDALKAAVQKNTAAQRRANTKSDRSGWVKYTQSSEYSEAARLSQDVAGTGWCTAESSTAAGQLSGGDFWVYYDKGKPEIALRTEDGKLAEPPRGTLEGQRLSEKYQHVAAQFLKTTKDVRGGEEFLEAQKAMTVFREYKRTGTVSRKEDLAYFVFNSDGTNGTFQVPAQLSGYSAIEEYDAPGLTAHIEDGVFWGGIRTGTISLPYKKISGDLDAAELASAPLLESVGGSLYANALTSVPLLESVGGSLYANALTSAPLLKSVGGHLDAAELTSAPLLESIGESIPFSAIYATGAEPLTDAQKQAIEDELVKTVNLKPVWAKLIQGTDGKPWSGDWTPDMIRIAIAAADPMGVARHESIHQFFHLLRKNGGENVKQVLERLSQNGIIRKRLEQLLADHPAAIKQLSDPEEFAAYAYQFWRAERLELGPKTEGFFQRVWTALKEILGLVQKQVKDAQHAEQILQAFSEGKVAAEPDVVIQALEKDAKAHNQRMENMRVLLRDSGLHQALRKAVFTAGGTLDGYGIEALTKARKLFDTGEGDAITEQSFFEAKAQETAKRLNQLRDILNGGRRYINGEWKSTDIKPTKKDIELLSEALRARKRPNDAIVGRMYDSVQQYLKEMHAYLVGAKTARWDEEAKQWVPMGEIKDYVMPQVWDVEKIMENPQLVVDRLMEKHLPVLEKIAQEAGGAKPESIAQAIVQRIIASAGAKDLEESTMDIGMTPYMRSVNKRTLNWIDAEAFAEFMQKDIVNILSSYTVQGVKRAEYVRRFGNGGTKLSALANEAMVEVVAGKGELPQYKAKLKALVREWVKAGREGDAPTMRDALAKEKGEEAVLKGLKHLDPAFKALMAMEGTLGYDIDPRVRQLMSGVTTYQNLRLLWLAIFSSFGDPLGIVVRGGEMKDAWNAFARGVREVRLRWKNEHSTDDLARLAEQLGTVDAGSFLDALGQTYSSVFMYGKFKTINDALFKWNGMEAWNRAMRIQATGAAVGFIKSHLTKSNEHSERYLKQELGLDPAQKGKWLTKDGELDYSRDEVKTAVMRWVDGAILRPNAAQRPVYASDPHYALFYHLKQFVYSFHKTILKRAYVEAQHGNWSPAAALVVAYVPVLIAADLAKELLLPDDDPPWMKQGLSGAVSHGFWRANLLGVPGLGLEAYRREDGSSLLGPQIDQFADLVSVPFSERRTALGEGLGALPGGSVWRRMAD